MNFNEVFKFCIRMCLKDGYGDEKNRSRFPHKLQESCIDRVTQNPFCISSPNNKPNNKFQVSDIL